MTAFVLETLLLLFIMFVIGIISGLMLRRARARKLALLGEADESVSPDFVAPQRAPTRPAAGRSRQDEGEEQLQEAAPRLPSDEGKIAQSQLVADSENDLTHRPPVLAAPEGSVADDLKRLKGIGPGNERKLHELGIFHFRQIAAWTPEQIAWVGRSLSFPGRVEREDWVGQAKAMLEEGEGA